MKKIIIIALLILLTVGCSNEKIEKFNLDSKYYETNEFIKIDADELKDEKNYILYTYNNYCNFRIPCDEIFKTVMEENDFSILSMPIEEFKKTSFYKKVKYAPSILIVKDRELVAYLDAESDEDLDKYQDTTSFLEWIKKYVYLKE